MTKSNMLSRAELVTLLNDISEAVLIEDELTEALQYMINRVSGALEASAGTISRPDPTEQHLELVARHSSEAERIELPIFDRDQPIETGPEGKAYVNEKPVEIENIEQVSECEQASEQPGSPPEIQSLISVPLIARNQTLGVVTLYFNSPRDFTDEIREIIEFLAREIAITMWQGDLIKELEEKNRKLQRLAETDGLTGLPNHRKIQNILRDEIARCKRYDNPVSVLMVDIDDFKQVNDSHGHLVGDEVLKQISNLFESKSRETDSVGRYGGEEFMFVLPETTSSEAFNLGERIRESVAELIIEHEDQKISVTVSIGIASISGDSTLEPSDFIKQADEALYRAKQTGKNRTIRDDQLSRPPMNDYQPMPPSR